MWPVHVLTVCTVATGHASRHRMNINEMQLGLIDITAVAGKIHALSTLKLTSHGYTVMMPRYLSHIYIIYI